MEEDFAVLGLSPDQPGAAEWLAQVMPKKEQTHFEVMEENLDSVEVFLAMQTNWRVLVAGLGGVIFQGIDYTALQKTFFLMGIPRQKHPQIFQDIRLMESEAIPLLNKVNKK